MPAGSTVPAAAAAKVNPGTGLTLTQEAAAIAAAAAKYKVDPLLLLGIFGHESTFGTAYGAGATQTFGFFGLTSSGLWHPGMSFAQDADTAAQTLAADIKSAGSVNAGVLKYSGNSYDQSSAMQMAASNPTLNGLLAKGGVINSAGSAVSGAAGSVGSAISSAAGAVTAPFTAAESIAALVTSGAFWLRVLEGIGGIVLLILGLRALSGGDGNPITVTTNAAKKVGQGAAVAAA